MIISTLKKILDISILFFKFTLLFYTIIFKKLRRTIVLWERRRFPKKFKCSWVMTKEGLEKEYQRNKEGYDNVVERMCVEEDKLILEKLKKEFNSGKEIHSTGVYR